MMMHAAADLLETTEDAFLGGRLLVRQPRNGYRAGLDAVLLAAACPAQVGRAARVLDCGAGAGVVGLCAARRIADADVTLVEREPALVALAEQNCGSNGLADRCRVVVADVTRPLSQVPALAAAAGTFDHVLMNPPYYSQSDGTRAPDSLKDGSHAMQTGEMEHWLRFAAAMTRDGGSLTLIHRPDVLPEILSGLARRFGRVRIVPLYPRSGEAASRILVVAIKASRAPLAVCAGHNLHEASGHQFTSAFDAILRDGAAFPIDA
jgi:tRNA1(Val) A37 N6-methylase TrmN6